MLWIAFSFVSLIYRTQPWQPATPTSICCELLSVLYLWYTGHNKNECHNGYQYVVNCFQFCIFDIPDTTNSNLVILRLSCELLSVLYLWYTGHNHATFLKKFFFVVNCFQFCIFDIPDTTLNNFKTTVHSCELLSVLYLWYTGHNIARYIKLIIFMLVSGIEK